MGRFCLHVMLLVLSNTVASGVCSAATFTFVNKCQFTVWPGILSNAGIAPLETTGFSLQTGETRIISGPPSWGGRFWGRTQCGLDSTGKFSCVTGDCGSGKVECAGGGAAPPATLAEFTLDGDAGKDFYDVSLVDGYNVPMLLVPQGGSGENCTNTGCIRDLNSACPATLQVMSSGGERVACKSACEAFGNDEYCCVGAYGTPQSCQPLSIPSCSKARAHKRTATLTMIPPAPSHVPVPTTSSCFALHPTQVKNRHRAAAKNSPSTAPWCTKAHWTSVVVVHHHRPSIVAPSSSLRHCGCCVINYNFSSWARPNVVGLWRINGPRMAPCDEELDHPESPRQYHSI